MTEILCHFKDIIEKYDRFIFDQWGVLHNGHKPLGDAVRILETLKHHDKKIVLLSNSSKLADENDRNNKNIGISCDLYDDVITSGEAVNRALHQHHIKNIPYDNPNIYFIAWDENRGMVRGFAHHEVTDITHADMVICAGTIYDDIDDYANDLNQALQRQLPMVVANPDLWSMRPDGSLAMCPGYVAKTYEEMGGDVIWFGKPLAIMYQFCHDIMNGLENCLAIGDSLAHDIKGANDSGIDSLLIVNGVHRFDLKYDKNPMINISDVEELSKKYRAYPTYVMPILTL